MLAQLKTVVLNKETIKLAFFRLVEYLQGLITGSKWPETNIFWNSSVYSCSEKWRLFHERKCQETEDLINDVHYSLHRTVQTGSNRNRKRSGRPRCTTEQEDKYIWASSLRNRRLTSPQLAASLNSTCKTHQQNTSLKVKSEEEAPGCWPWRTVFSSKAPEGVYRTDGSLVSLAGAILHTHTVFLFFSWGGKEVSHIIRSAPLHTNIYIYIYIFHLYLTR